MTGAVVTPSDVPVGANVDIPTSSFFQRHSQLPSPEEVRLRARAQYYAGTHWGWKARGVSEGYNARPSPAVFEEMSLFVKWGANIRITEGQTLYAIRSSCANHVPVPEIYGWRTDGGETFLYMEAISGRTLEEAWPGMTDYERVEMCEDLRNILYNLRLLQQHPMDRFIAELVCILARLFTLPI